MPTPLLDKAIRDRIEAFVTEIAALVRNEALDAVMGALGATEASPAASPVRRSKKKAGRKGRSRKAATAAAPAARKSKGRKKSGKRVRRTNVSLDRTAEKVVAYLKANPEQSITDIASGMGIKSATLKKPIANLLEARTISKTGERRGTRYTAK